MAEQNENGDAKSPEELEKERAREERLAAENREKVRRQYERLEGQEERFQEWFSERRENVRLYEIKRGEFQPDLMKMSPEFVGSPETARRIGEIKAAEKRAEEAAGAYYAIPDEKESVAVREILGRGGAENVTAEETARASNAASLRARNEKAKYSEYIAANRERNRLVREFEEDARADYRDWEAKERERNAAGNGRGGKKRSRRNGSGGGAGSGGGKADGGNNAGNVGGGDGGNGSENGGGNERGKKPQSKETPERGNEKREEREEARDRAKKVKEERKRKEKEAKEAERQEDRFRRKMNDAAVDLTVKEFKRMMEGVERKRERQKPEFVKPIRAMDARSVEGAEVAGTMVANRREESALWREEIGLLKGIQALLGGGMELV